MNLNKGIYSKIAIFSFTLIGFLFGLTPAYAGSSEASDVPAIPVFSEYQVEARALAETYTIDDIYTLLNSSLKGTSSSTTYSLPYIANRINLINNKLATVNTDMSTMLTRWNTTNSELVNISTDTGNIIQHVRNVGNSVDNVKIDTTSISSNTSNISTNTSNIKTNTDNIKNDTSSIKTGIDNIYNEIDSIYNLNWTPAGTLKGISLNSGTSYSALTPPQTITGSDFYIYISPSYSTTDNVIYKIFIPVRPAPLSNYVNKVSLKFYYANNSSNVLYNELFPDYTYQITNYGTEIYIQNFNMFQNSTNFVIKYISDNSLTYSSNAIASIDYISSDVLTYWLINQSIINDNINNNLDRITKLYASDDQIAAKEAQQEYEDDVLSDFTGDGDAASKRSDSGGAKNISKKLRQNLDSGGSVNNTLDIFSDNSANWGFFSLQTYQNLHPLVLPNTRSSSNDYNNDNEVLDFLTPRNEEYYRILNENGQSFK